MGADADECADGGLDDHEVHQSSNWGVGGGESHGEAASGTTPRLSTLPPYLVAAGRTKTTIATNCAVRRGDHDRVKHLVGAELLGHGFGRRVAYTAAPVM